MKWFWTGWLLCLITAGLFGYMAVIEVPAISAMLGGMVLPDAMPLGYDEQGARALYEAFAADFTAAQAEGRRSASAAYLAMHAMSDLLLPPLLAASLAFCAFASIYTGRRQAETSRLVSIGLGLVLAAAFVYLICDFIENAVADAMYGPTAMKAGFNDQLAFALKVLTIGKYSILAVAFGLIAALWIARWKRGRGIVPDVSQDG